MTETAGTFLVTSVDPETAVVRDVETGQVHPLSENPGLEEGAVVEATLTAEPPMEVTWAAEIESTRRIDLVESDLEPTALAREVAADQSVGEVTRRERAGEGEIHVLTVPDGDVQQAATDVLEDQATVERAARLGVVRVEVRTGDGLVSVRYLPE